MIFTFIGLLYLAPRGKRLRLLQKAVQVKRAAETIKTLVELDSHDTDSSSSGEGFLDGERDPVEIAEDLKTDTQCLMDRGYRFGEQTVGHSTQCANSRRNRN